MLIPIEYVGKALPKEIKEKIKNKNFDSLELNNMYRSILKNKENNKSSVVANGVIFFIVFAFLGYQATKSLDDIMFGFIFGAICYLVIMAVIIYFYGLAKSQFLKLIKKYYSEEYDKIINITDNNIDTNLYGGFIISKNVTQNGVKAKWVFRNPSSIKECNGWNIYSENDSQEYVLNPSNFEIVSATTIQKYIPILLSIYEAPYGTDLTLKYANNDIVGFIDTKTGQDISIDQIIKK